MLYSMTGYGKCKFELHGKQFTVDIKTLNSRQIDLFIKCPFELKEFDLEVRKIISDTLLRGKIELVISENKMTDSSVNINFTLLEKYYSQIQDFLSKNNMPQSELISSLLRHPDIIKSEMPALSEDDVQILFTSIKSALAEVNLFRQREGLTLEKDLLQRVNSILLGLDNIAPLEQVRIIKLRDKLNTELAQLKIESDANRFEQELIFYLEKLDITEEKIRLKTHGDYFIKFLNDSSKEKGKKLNFIIQEIGREINTIGSKANSADIQQLVIQMKDELEKIKEQLNNIL